MSEVISSPAPIATSVDAPATAPTTLGVKPAAPAQAVRKLGEPVKPDKGGWIWGTGRRKTAVARVRIKPGSGKFIVNDREADKFFTEIRDRNDIVAPLKVTSTQGKMDVVVKVAGGGYTGQAGAIVLGLARALKGYDPTLETSLRDQGMLTRDSRKVERKKYGRPGARRGFQWAKR